MSTRPVPLQEAHIYIFTFVACCFWQVLWFWLAGANSIFTAEREREREREPQAAGRSYCTATGYRYRYRHRLPLPLPLQLQLLLLLQLQLQLQLHSYRLQERESKSKTNNAEASSIQEKIDPGMKTRKWLKRGSYAPVAVLFSTAAAVAILNYWLFGGDNAGVRGARSAAPNDPLRVAVCFFGLTRSLRWTLPSIERRLLGVLRDSGMQVEIFLHTYDLLQVNNHRAEEIGIEYHKFTNDFRALHPNRTSVTDQDEFDRTWPDPLSLTRYRWNYKEDNIDPLIRNVFRAYWSMAAVWSLLVQYCMETSTRYDAVVLARPDVWFHVDTDLTKREFPLPERTVFLPSFEAEPGGQRKNDRFAYGSMTAMGVLMNRIATLTDPKANRHKQSNIDSEWVMGHHLKVNDIKVETMEFSVTRVRLTGSIPLHDHERVEEACESGEDPMACEMVRLGFKFPIEDSKP